MGLERVLLIRHGLTDWNAQSRWQGIEPTPLNEIGFAQARQLAAYLKAKNEPLKAIHTSDLPRALQTATIIGEALDITPQIDLRWREINVGIFQGLTAEEVERLYVSEIKAWRSDDLTYIVPEGESRLQLQERAVAAWLEVIERETASEIAIVSHGGTIRWLLRALFGHDNPRIKAPINNTSVTTLECVDGDWQLVSMGDIAHLPSELRHP